MGEIINFPLEMANVYHIQKTYAYCHKCKQEIEILKYEISSGSDFLKVDPRSYGWSVVSLKGKMVLLCPKHKIKTLVFADGEELKD